MEAMKRLPRNRHERRAMWSKRKGDAWRIIMEGVGIELHATKGYRRGKRYGKVPIVEAEAGNQS